MAKKSKGDDDGGRIRVIIVELEGSNATIQDSLRTVATALRPAIVAPRPSLPNSYQPTDVEALPPEVLEEEEIVQDKEPTTAKKRRTSSGTKRAARPPEPVEIDFNTGDMPLEKYAQLKNPRSEVDRYVFIADWLKRYRGINSINKAHIYTCFRALSWKVSSDLTQPFRTLLNEDFMRVGKGEYAITVLGENRVQKMGAKE
jgi:hypothetical protein